MDREVRFQWDQLHLILLCDLKMVAGVRLSSRHEKLTE
jgi:hypothetical protein